MRIEEHKKIRKEKTQKNEIERINEAISLQHSNILINSIKN